MPAKKLTLKQKKVAEPKPSKDDQIAELTRMVKELQKSAKKPTRKLSALNKFKKYVVGPLTDEAIAETDYIELIPVDKMRLLNQAYPIVWDELVLQPLYEKYNLKTAQQQKAFKAKRNIQLEYNLQVDSIIDQMKEGEADDQEHFHEDLVNLLKDAIEVAAESFEGDDDDDEAEEEVEE